MDKHAAALQRSRNIAGLVNLNAEVSESPKVVKRLSAEAQAKVSHDSDGQMSYSTIRSTSGDAADIFCGGISRLMSSVYRSPHSSTSLTHTRVTGVF